MALQADRGVPLSTLSPKFLHSNSTSHTWPFSAIAELIDNAYDPDVNAKQLWIDKTVFHGNKCLTFTDNGNGLTYETMQKMLSFGYSNKTASNGKEPIGIYGNGFKSGSMRLGRDAIVFSNSNNTHCVGMLSQTYLEKIHSDQIIIPIVRFEGERHKLRAREEDQKSLQDILQYSPFKTEEQLLLEMIAISSPLIGKTGTRIIIWNLCRTSAGKLEFDFETDRYDIRIPLDVSESFKDAEAASYMPESFLKLRAYCSILYLKPKMQIIIRGQKVQTQLIAKSLAHIRKDHYKPNFLPRRIPITFGYNTKSKDHYGVMMYHKNRLIKAYKRVGCQLKANNKGVGVIAVIECNFLDPTHNKQSFNESDKYSKTIANLGIKLEEYWNEIHHKRREENPHAIPVEDTVKRPDQNWVQCDECLNWRKIPDGIDCETLPDKWFCYMNPDPQFRSCLVEEEPEDSDGEEPTYRKTYKQQEREEKKKKELERQKEEEKRKREEEKRLTKLTRKNRALKRKLRKCLPQLVNVTPEQNSVASPPVLQPACSSSINDGFPVIANVCSLSPEVRLKRPQPTSPQTTPKRQKHDLLNVSNFSPSTSVEGNPQMSLLEDSTRSDIPDTLGKLGNSTTQTDLLNVKKEEPQSQNEWQRSQEREDDLAIPFCVKQQPSEQEMHDSTHGDNPGMSRFQREVPLPLDGQLQMSMQTAAQERDALKEQVESLRIQLQETQVRLKELTVKEECSHQTDNQDLFRTVKQKIEELIKNSTVSLPATQTATSAVQGEEKYVDDVVQPVEFLLWELEQRNKERDELFAQLEAVENKMRELKTQCEEQNSKHGDPWNASKMGCSSTLISLRQNISRLLVTFLPGLDLDLNQVNYECEVIDEILEQVVMHPGFGETANLKLKENF